MIEPAMPKTRIEFVRANGRLARGWEMATINPREMSVVVYRSGSRKGDEMEQ